MGHPINAANFLQFCRVNALYEEEIEILNRGIAYTKQRLEYLHLIHHHLRHEYQLYQQISIQKEYLVFNLAHGQYKEVDERVMTLWEGLQHTRHELLQVTQNDQSEWSSLSRRWMELLTHVQQKMKHVFHSKPANGELQGIQSRYQSHEQEVASMMKACKQLLEVSNDMQKVEQLVHDYEQAQQRHLPDVQASIRAYDNYEADVSWTGRSAASLTSLANSQAASKTASLAAGSAQMSSHDLSASFARSAATARQEKDYLYAVAALEQGAHAARELLQQAQQILQSLEALQGRWSSLLPYHPQLQEHFQQVEVVLSELIAFIDKEKIRRTFHTSLGKFFLGNELHIIPNFYPDTSVKEEKEGDEEEDEDEDEGTGSASTSSDSSSTQAQAIHSVRFALPPGHSALVKKICRRWKRVHRRWGGVQGVQQALQAGPVASDRDQLEILGFFSKSIHWVNLKKPGRWVDKQHFEVNPYVDDLSCLPAGFIRSLQPEDIASSGDGLVIMKNRSILKPLPKPAAKGLARTKTSQNVKEASPASNKYVPALVANIERKTSTKNMLAAALADQSAWKYLNLKEPTAADPTIASIGNFMAEIKAMEERLAESAGRVEDAEIQTTELTKQVEEVMNRLAQSSEEDMVDRSARREGRGPGDGRRGEAVDSSVDRLASRNVDPLDSLLERPRNQRLSAESLHRQVVMSDEEIAALLASFGGVAATASISK